MGKSNVQRGLDRERVMTLFSVVWTLDPGIQRRGHTRGLNPDHPQSDTRTPHKYPFPSHHPFLSTRSSLSTPTSHPHIHTYLPTSSSLMDIRKLVRAFLTGPLLPSHSFSFQVNQGQARPQADSWSAHQTLPPFSAMFPDPSYNTGESFSYPTLQKAPL